MRNENTEREQERRGNGKRHESVHVLIKQAVCFVYNLSDELIKWINIALCVKCGER